MSQLFSPVGWRTCRRKRGFVLLTFRLLMCKHSLTVHLPLPSNELANIVYGSLSVDTEPVRGGCKKTFKVEDNILIVQFQAQEARIVRVAVGHFFELSSLVIKTIEQFGGEKWLKNHPQPQIQEDASMALPSSY